MCITVQESNLAKVTRFCVLSYVFSMFSMFEPSMLVWGTSPEDGSWERIHQPILFWLWTRCLLWLWFSVRKMGSAYFCYFCFVIFRSFLILSVLKNQKGCWGGEILGGLIQSADAAEATRNLVTYSLWDTLSLAVKVQGLGTAKWLGGVSSISGSPVFPATDHSENG